VPPLWTQAYPAETARLERWAGYWGGDQLCRLFNRSEGGEDANKECSSVELKRKARGVVFLGLSVSCTAPTALLLRVQNRRF
jgi:hypothetical protein